jgi:hypothetical protein
VVVFAKLFLKFFAGISHKEHEGREEHKGGGEINKK